MIKAKSYLILILDFLLFIIGIMSITWILYTRFIRHRIPKDIPLYLSEYGFWLLLYICLLYLYIIISLLKNKTKTNSIAKQVSDILYFPMVYVDQAIKYNKHAKTAYYDFMYKAVNYLQKLSKKQILVVTLLFQIVPRTFLILFLFIDIWIYHHIEIFYNFILLGLISFIYRYIKHSFKELKQHYIEQIEKKYDEVWMIDKNSKDDLDFNTDMQIKDYIEFKILQKIYYNSKVTSNDKIFDVNKEYDETIIAKETTYQEYRKNNNLAENVELTKTDYNLIEVLFHDIKNKVLDLGVFVENYSTIENHRVIRWAKIFIFSLYFISWAYVLIISYYANPITFINTAYKLVQTLLNIEEPFSGIIL